MIATTDYELLTDSVGLVPRGGRAVLALEGSEAAEFLQGQVTNDIEALAPGSGCYAALLNHKGKLRADMRVLRLAPDRLQLDTDAAAGPVLQHTFKTYSLGRDVRSRDLTGERQVLSLIGPDARAAVESPPPAREHAFSERPHWLQVTTDLGVDLVVESSAAAGLIDALGVPLASEEAAECVRIETGRPRLGFDMDDSTIPQEAALNDRAVSFTKGCYVGQETVARLHYKGKPNRHLRGLRLSEPAERGDPVEIEGKQVGKLGSACVSPTFGPIALALLRREASPGDEVLVGPSKVSARVVDLPFARS
ncbi:MAG TPA: glycine cleavage T C-terminal barrel domain-containing protein [Thermoleophilaceae bacterium]|nr:glycine cleavage T C-terminal barrel domain-containing protein [Thermoleophilaceae bacterium]